MCMTDWQKGDIDLQEDTGQEQLTQISKQKPRLVLFTGVVGLLI